ncbi:hypothetical protein ACS0VU_10700 [Aliiroseovarius sp. KMU-71]|uniref:hypothetical protein n=1 Tax=Aliiroseovarius sp. KMU-71 TaxID=3453123 RepID=UPI003F4540AE
MNSQKDNRDKPKAKPIFFDPTSHRLVLFSVLSAVFLVFAVVWFVSFLVHLHESELPPQVGNSDLSKTEVSDAIGSPNLTEDEAATASQAQLWTDAIEGTILPGDVYIAQDAKVHAFVPSWSMAGYVEARTHIDAIDVLMTDWVTIDGTTGAVTTPSAPRRISFGSYGHQTNLGLVFSPLPRSSSPKEERNQMCLPRSRNNLV